MAATPEQPIVLIERWNQEAQLFRDASHVASYLEAIDVINDEFEAYDAEAGVVRLEVIKTGRREAIRVRQLPDVPPMPEQLKAK